MGGTMTSGNTIEDDLLFLEYANSLPSSDLDTLHALSPPDLRAWAVARAEIYRNYALALLSIHNVIAPIHRLPNEILSEIFAWAGHPPRGIHVMHVCQRWRAILWKTPTFWANILEGERFDLQETPHTRELGKRMTYLATALDNSSPEKSLKIRTAHFPPALPSLLEQHSSRIGTLNVAIYNMPQKTSLFQALAPGMPHLKELTIEFCWEQENPMDAWCFAEGLLKDIKPLSSDIFPRLISVIWPALLAPLLSVNHLEHVKLRGFLFVDNRWSYPRLLSAARIPSPEAFLKFLDCVKSTKTLRLLDGALPESMLVSPEDQATYFPYLTSLRISDDRGVVSRAIPYIHLPPHAAVHFSDPQLGESQIPFVSGAALRSSSWNEVISIIDRVEMVTSMSNNPYCKHMWSIRGYCNGAQRLRFDYIETSISQEISLEPFKTDSRITHLLHNLGHPFHHKRRRLEERDDQLLRALPHLRSLHVINEGFSGILKALQRAGSDGLPVVCPVLEDLVIECCYNIIPLAPGEPAIDLYNDVVAGRFGVRLKELVVALQARAAHGTRLRSLTWSELDKTALRQDRSRRATKTFVVENWGLDENDPDLQTLRSLVDGEVKIGEFRLYAANAQEART